MNSDRRAFDRTHGHRIPRWFVALLVLGILVILALGALVIEQW